MLIVELIKCVIPTRSNKLKHAQRYQLNQKIIKELESEAANRSESDLEDHKKLVAEYERRQQAQTPAKRELEHSLHNLCDKTYLFMTKNWPTDPSDV